MARYWDAFGLSSDTYEDLFAEYIDRIEEINESYIRKMAEHIRDIGQMTASDVDRLEAMRRCGRDMAQVERQIREASGIYSSQREWNKVVKATTNSGITFLNDVLGAGTIKLEDNKGLQLRLAALLEQTRTFNFGNFSNTTVVSAPYQNAIDKAILAVQSGTTDYYSAIRGTVRQTCQEGLIVLQDEQDHKRRLGQQSGIVRYSSMHTRRLDTAVRQNILDGVRQISQQQMKLIGEELRADGWEISAHMLCAEDHVDYQGEQFTKSEFDALQRSLRRPFGEWNCRHMWWPVFIGISRPTHTREELEQYKNYSREQITIVSDDGKEITRSRYEWTQEMRRLETAIRYESDVNYAADIMKDIDLKRQCSERMRRYEAAYEKISKSAGILEDRRRFAGSRDIRTRKVKAKPPTPPVKPKRTTSAKSKAASKPVTPPKPEKANYGAAVEGIKDQKYRELAQQYLDNAPADVRAVWTRCQNDLSAPNYNGIGARGERVKGAYYSPSAGKTYFQNADKCFGRSNYQSEMTVYFHEFGHNIDALLAKYQGAAGKHFSDTFGGAGTFKQAVLDECDRYYLSWMKNIKGFDADNLTFADVIKANTQYSWQTPESIFGSLLSGKKYKGDYGSIMDEFIRHKDDAAYIDSLARRVFSKRAYDGFIGNIPYAKKYGQEFCDWMKSHYDIYARSDISDMFEPYTYKKFGIDYPFDIGHGAKYLKNDYGATETFAEMFSAYATGNTSYDTIKEVFPDTLGKFKKMLEEAAK